MMHSPGKGSGENGGRRNERVCSSNKELRWEIEIGGNGCNGEEGGMQRVNGAEEQGSSAVDA
jgi:hypothetical protein